MTELPLGWAEATVGDLFHYVRGVTYSKADATKVGDAGRLPVLRANNFNHTFDLSDLVFLPSEMISEDQRLRGGDLLFAMSSGSKSHVGKCILVKQKMNAGFGAFCGVLRPADAAFSRLFSNAFQSKAFRNYIEELAAGTNINNLKRDLLLGYKIPIPPLNEQRRIVEKIEAMFDEIDKGAESLQTARATLGLYRQSLLKSAFEGRLTADWRAQNPDKLEAPETLLARIQRERDNHYKAALDTWQDALAAWRADGETGKKPAKPKQPATFPDEPQNLRIELPELPPGWVWTQLGLCSSGPGYGTAAKSADTGAVPVIRMGNLQRGRIDWDNLAFTSDPDEIGQYSLRAGDVLFNRTNSPELVGKTSIYKGERPALFAGYLVRLNQIEEIASGPYLNYFLNSPFASEHGKTVKTDGVNQSNINATKLQEYPFPYCSPAEQAEIVRLLDARLEAADALEAEIDGGLTRASALRQSILKKAFSGHLVPQDPNDEPAAVLLEQIKADRAKAPKAKKRKVSA
jgi:type I restriction enzyme S subunit